MPGTSLKAASGALAIVLAMSAVGEARAQATASATRGKVLFLRCSSCHTIASTATAKIGPSLNGIVGRQGGSLPGAHYSAAMKAKAPVWTEENLDLWLTAPTKLVPGTSMAFAGLPNPSDRAAVIAYLKTLR